MKTIPPILQVTDFRISADPAHPECAVVILFVLHEGITWKVELNREHGLRLAREIGDLLLKDCPTQPINPSTNQPQ